MRFQEISKLFGSFPRPHGQKPKDLLPPAAMDTDAPFELPAAATDTEAFEVG